MDLNIVNNELLQDIIAQFKETEKISERIIPYEVVISWMRNGDLEAIGALYSYIVKSQYYMKIKPNLTAEDYSRFIRHYFKRCILENPSSDWTNSRYEAGWDFVNWFNNFWDDPHVSKSIVYELKEWLENLYKDGNNKIRECIITAILEHLFEKAEISEFFSDWKNDPLLKEAYEEAMFCAGKIKGPTALSNSENQ